MAKLEGHAFITDGDQFVLETDSTPRHELGTELRLADGRVFRYGKAASTSSKGKLQVAPAPIDNHKNMACAAAAAGATQVTVTPGATGGDANIYAEGYLVINDVDGEGQAYKVKGHAAITSSVAFVVELFDPIKTALTANSEATLVHNAYNGVVEAAVEERRAAGVPLVTFAAGDYGWFQVKGPCPVLAGAAVDLAHTLVSHASTAGAVDGQSETIGTSHEQVVIGQASFMALVDTEYRPVNLTIA